MSFRVLTVVTKSDVAVMYIVHVTERKCWWYTRMRLLGKCILPFNFCSILLVISVYIA